MLTRCRPNKPEAASGFLQKPPRGGPDNITVALVEIGGETETTGNAEPGT
jgi:hypothetical protein